MTQKLEKQQEYLALIAWIQAFIALLGSLYFSEVLKLPPCVLCWYQRIFIYPLVVIIAVGLLKKDQKLPFYVLPFSISGIGVALFHYLLQQKILPEAVAPCQTGISCVETNFQFFGFINIPFLSFLAFLLITICMFIFIKQTKKSNY